MVKEMRVRWSLPEKAKVVSGWHNATPHEMVPDAIDDDPRSQWIGWIVYQGCQLKSATPFSDRKWSVTRYCSEEVPGLNLSRFC
jgi:hypothetical protein